MSLLESLAQLLMGGPPMVDCAGCGMKVSGDDLGAVLSDGTQCWCKPCAEQLPDEV